MIDFEIDCGPAPAAPRAVAQQHLRPHGIGNPSLRRAVFVSRFVHLGEGDEVRKRAQVHRIRGPDELLQLYRVIGQDVVHARRQQQQTDQMRLAGVGKLAKAQVVEQVVGQPDLFATALELAEVAEAEELFHRCLMQEPGSRKLILTTVTGGLR